MLKSGYCPLEKNAEKLYKKTDQGQSKEIRLVDGNTEASKTQEPGPGSGKKNKKQNCHSLTFPAI